MTWPCSFEKSRIDLAATGRIDSSDADRQMATAREILGRLETQPGLILADEVGMGKTFVALAVAASASWGDAGRGPVVVMVPPSLKEKWPRDFMKFRNECLIRPEDKRENGLRYGSADNGVDFLKLLDDPASRRSHVIFVTHGALYRGLRDPWTKLALLVEALRHRSLVAQRGAFPRFAADIVQTKSAANSEAVYADLQKTDPEFWKSVLVNHGVLPEEEDDPVPKAICRLLEKDRIDLGELREALKGAPLRDSANRADRIRGLREALRAPLKELWMRALRDASFRSPLLILDEAHHLKNPETKLASLFVEEGAESDADLLGGALQGKFERMLFLTATPFQLGHGELLNVLDRFRGIRWSVNGGGEAREAFQGKLTELRTELDGAQRSALELEKAWRRVRPGHVGTADPDGELDTWWAEVLADAERGEGQLRDVVRQYQATARRMESADRKLRPWVIRHLRSRILRSSGDDRRRTIPGAGIANDDVATAAGITGLPVDGAALLPFLLVARSQAIISGLPSAQLRTQVGNSSFVEGLASSFEAYWETRQASSAGGHAVVDESQEVAAGGGGVSIHTDRLKRYVGRLDRALVGLHDQHPKVKATVAKATELWKKGEKVLVFCHFRATVRALAEHLSRSIQREIEETVMAELGCDRSEVDHRLELINKSFDTTRSAFHRLETRVDRLLAPYGDLGESDRETIKRVVRRFVRTDSFLVRYFPLKEGGHEERLDAAFERPDGSGLTLEDRIERFIRFMAERSRSERTPFLDALESIRTGSRGDRSETEEQVDEEGSHALSLPVVRVANGSTKQETRQRLMLAFNAPFFPEILVASSVLAEGVDLHLDCRHVIHHDLDWNPSTLEQRTGRVDRIGAKAERSGRSIQIYLPYVDGTQDEKMFRVVRDRERWFQVVMGESYRLDELGTDRIAERVPFPQAAARSLGFQLEVWRDPAREDTAIRASGPDDQPDPSSTAAREEPPLVTP